MPSGRPKNTNDRREKVCRAFDKAVENLTNGGTITDLADIWQEMIAQDPFKAFQTYERFMPRVIESKHEENITQTIHYVAMPNPEQRDAWFTRHHPNGLN